MSLTTYLDEKFAHAALQAEIRHAEITAGLLQTVNGNRVYASRAVPNPVTAGSGTSLLNGGKARIMGWTLRNANAAGQLVVNLYDGRDTSGGLLATASIGSNSAWAQSTPWYGPSGIAATEAVYLEVIATGGAILAGAFHLGAMD